MHTYIYNYTHTCMNTSHEHFMKKIYIQVFIHIYKNRLINNNGSKSNNENEKYGIIKQGLLQKLSNLSYKEIKIKCKKKKI